MRVCVARGAVAGLVAKFGVRGSGSGIRVWCDPRLVAAYNEPSPGLQAPSAKDPATGPVAHSQLASCARPAPNSNSNYTHPHDTETPTKHWAHKSCLESPPRAPSSPRARKRTRVSSPPPRWGGMVLATSKRTQDKEPLRAAGCSPPHQNRKTVSKLEQI